MMSMAMGSRYPSSRLVSPAQASEWLGAGWRDMWRHPGLSLGFGALYAGIGATIYAILTAAAMGALLFPLLAGFMLVGPLAAVFFYEISRRVENGEPVSLALVVAGVRRRLGQVGNMGLVLTILFMVWLLLGLMIFALFHPPGAPLSMDGFLVDVVLKVDSIGFLAVGALVGGTLAVIAFSVSVFAMPMLLERDVGVVEAMLFSVHSVWRNWRGMVGWAATIAVITFFGMALAFLGMVVALPLVGHASWHAYRDVIGEDVGSTL
ncbi:DUF2189 domain-containing protein [Magnetospirillum sp. SS-4]|uniref:DUF2189 domain-containing protein n=1 Tax=Magnetospirillum sp. SS-4 TaxID=2681465 RepID=UPI0013837C78|nr:DUF2189 domain-containing protein [Magnetospirillum sp. SS-4]CAA7622068.1 Integral membrane protein [Magnetospirillum sp. SS-4]